MDLDFEQVHKELMKQVGFGADNWVDEERAGDYQPIPIHSEIKFKLVDWGSELCSYQSTQEARNIIKGVIEILINDIEFGRVRSNFTLENIVINSYGQVDIDVHANPLEFHQLTDEQAKSKIYQKPLNCLKAMIVDMSSSGEVSRVPKDLTHLILYLKDFKTFWNARRFVQNHPSCWSNSKFLDMMLSMRSLLRNKDASNELMKDIDNAYPEGFVWKDRFFSHFIDNDNARYPEGSSFKDAAYSTYYPTAFRDKDDGVRLLTYLCNLLEQPRKKSNSKTKVTVDNLDNSYAVEVLEMINMLFPLFLPRIIDVSLKTV